MKAKPSNYKHKFDQISDWNTSNIPTIIKINFLFLFAEPFLESIPQVCIISVMMASNENVLSFDHVYPTYTLSVFSAAFCITKFLKAGPCRLIPYDKINFGLSFLLILSIGSHIIGKGISLAGSLTNMSQYFHGYRSLAVTTWICLSLLPQMIFVSNKFLTNSPINIQLSNHFILFLSCVQFFN